MLMKFFLVIFRTFIVCLLKVVGVRFSQQHSWCHWLSESAC